MKRFCLPRTTSAALKAIQSLTALAIVAVSISTSPAIAQTSVHLAHPETRITAKVDNAQRVPMASNVHYLTKSALDQGTVSGDTPMQRMILMLSHTDAQEAALVSLIASQQDKKSPLFHQWLTPATYGAQFGASDADIKQITDWLAAQGFTVSNIGNGRNTIEFSGTAAQVTAAFQTPIHKFMLAGVQYQANISDPTIPAALAPVVRGVLSMHNFPRHPHHVNVGNFQKDLVTGKVTKISSAANLPAAASRFGAAALPSPSRPTPDLTFTESGYVDYGVSPYDFATIYNILPLWKAGIDGTGQTIAVLQETNIHIDDVRAFKSVFGLPANDPVVILNGADPGVTAYDEGEADIDVEWAGAVAKGATIDLIVSASTGTTQGVDLSALYAVDNNVASITSMSYGECELGLATSGNTFFNTLWQQGAAQGISHFVSTGDNGSASCDSPNQTTAAAYGLQVSGMATTPYNTAVGGTDFLGTAISPSTFWNSTNNSTTQASALSYIPETTWNSDCTNLMFQKPFYNGGAGYGATTAAVCKSIGTAANGLIAPVGGSGGVSNCINGNGSTLASCTQGYAKPTWQTGVGVPADSHRDIPDVSMFASSGFFGSFYVYCQEDTNTDGKSCNVATASNSSATTEDFGGVGGTSVSTPAFAGVMALVNQKTNARQGVANYVLYDLFNQQTTSGTACTSAYTNISTSGSVAVMPASGCVFNDITFGSNSAPCVKNDTNCTTLSGNTLGILTVTATTPANEVQGDAYLNTVGYDLAVGLGSVNATNLVNSWANITFVPTATTLSLASTSFAHGTADTATIGVSPASGGGGTPTGNVELLTSTTPASLGFVPLSSGAATASFNGFPGGTYTVHAHYAGDGTYASSDSAPVSVTVTPENSTLAGSIAYTSPYAGTTTTNVTTAPYGTTILIDETATSASGQGVPTGTVTFLNNGSTLSTPATLNSSGQGQYQSTTLAPGSYSITGTYSGDASFNSSTSPAKAFTITKANSKVTQAATSTAPAAGAADTFTATVVGNNSSTTYGNSGTPPTGTVSVYSGATTGTLTTLLGTTNFTSSGTVTTYGWITSIAKITLANLPSGTDYITMVYSGDANYSAANGTSTKVTVAAATKTATTSTLSASPSSISYGGTTLLTATVSASSGTPTGSFTFYVDGVALGTAITLSGNSASTSTLATMTGGTHAITAIYSGDTTFLGSSGALNLVDSPQSDTLSLAGSATSATQGTTVSYIASVAYTGTANPTGTMTFSVDGNVTGTGIGVNSLVAGGYGAYFNTASLLPGNHTISVSYSGDKNYAAAAANASVTITAAPLLVLSTNQRNTIVLGAPVTINVSAQSINSGPIPTGTISYSVDGGTVTSGVALTSGTTSFTLTGLSLLKHTVTVIYSGDSFYTSVSQTITLNSDVSQTILFPGLSPATLAITPTVTLAARATSGLPVTYTVTGPATLSGSTLTLTGTGTVSVTASVAANSSFAAATSVTRSFIVQ